MSKSKLSDGDIKTKQKEFLHEAEKISREISKMSPHLLEDDGEEFTQFVGYVEELDEDVFCGFKNYDVPAHVVEDHRTAVSQVVYKSGTHKVVCDVVTSRLSTKNYVTQVEDITMIKSVHQMMILLGLLTDYSDSDKDVRVYMTEDSGFLPAVVHTLDAGHTPHLDNILSGNQNGILDCCIKILGNCSMNETNIPALLEAGTVKVVLPYLNSPDDSFKMASIVALAKLVNEKEGKSLLTNHVTIFTLLIQWLDIAWQSSGHRNVWGAHVTELTQTIRQLARNDTNKQVLVNKGCLPLLVEILNQDSQYDSEVSESLEALWVLSYDDVNKQKMVEEPNLIKRVWAKYSDDLANDEFRQKIKKSSYGILWSLYDKLKMGELEFVGIASKFQEQKTNLDLNEDSTQVKGHVMLSYNWGHKETIKQICQELKDAGFPVWIDEECMEGSTIETMAKAVEDCSIFIMAVSRGYKNSSNCRLEADYAQKLEKTIIPLKMEEDYKPDGWLGMIMGNKLFYDFSGAVKHPFEKTMSNLAKAIKNKIGNDKADSMEKGSLKGQQVERQSLFAKKDKQPQRTVNIIICNLL